MQLDESFGRFYSAGLTVKHLTVDMWLSSLESPCHQGRYTCQCRLASMRCTDLNRPTRFLTCYTLHCAPHLHARSCLGHVAIRRMKGGCFYQGAVNGLSGAFGKCTGFQPKKSSSRVAATTAWLQGVTVSGWWGSISDRWSDQHGLWVQKTKLQRSEAVFKVPASG